MDSVSDSLKALTIHNKSHYLISDTVYPLAIMPKEDSYESNQPSTDSVSDSLQALSIHDISHYLITGASGGSQPTHTKNDIIIDADGSVRAGTVPALVEHLTSHGLSGKSTWLPPPYIIHPSSRP